MKNIILPLVVASVFSTNAVAKGSSYPEETNTNQSVVYASERVLMISSERASYTPDYRSMVCLPKYDLDLRWYNNTCKDSNGKNAWQYMSDVAPVGFKFSRFFKPDRYTVFIVFEPK